WFGSILTISKFLPFWNFFLKFNKPKIYPMKRLLQKFSLLFIALLLSNSKLEAQAGAGLSFDGIDDKIILPNTALLNINDFTLEYWIKDNGLDAGWDRITS